jgi:hypothetical protein
VLNEHYNQMYCKRYTMIISVYVQLNLRFKPKKSHAAPKKKVAFLHTYEKRCNTNSNTNSMNIFTEAAVSAAVTIMAIVVSHLHCCGEVS